MRVTVEELAGMLDAAEVLGNRERIVEGAASIEKAGPGDVIFARDLQNFKKLDSHPPAAALIEKKLIEASDKLKLPITLIVVENALSAFLRVLELFYPRRAVQPVGISPAAHVDPGAQLGSGTNVFPGAHICGDVQIGENCSILPGAYVGPGCRIGNDVTLHPNVVLYDGVIVGDRVIVHASAVIGADGFGYRQVEGRHERIPHFGTVRVENDVEIGACATIDRSMIGETVIGEGTKIDNLVMIAHNCEIGPHNMFASQVGFAGSVSTGRYVVCAGQVGVADHVHLGDGAVFGAKAGVHRNMPGGQNYLGSPAAPETKTSRMWMAYRRLPELRDRVLLLEQQLAELTGGTEQNSESADSSNCAA